MPNRKLTLPGAFLALLGLAAAQQIVAPSGGPRTAEIVAQKRLDGPDEPGTLPTSWFAGNDCATEPPFQVHAYNDNLFLLRQSKCATFEAPFLYLLFGEERALLMDTGSAPQLPTAAAVGAVVQDWLNANGKTSIPLVVAHTHSHGDHVAGDFQFQSSPFVETLVGLGLQDVTSYWGFQDYPNDVPTIDLGGRVIDVLGTPGHQSASITLYDRNTHLLLTGDIVYPGHLFVFSAPEWPQFGLSIQRLVNWAATHPVEWVLGCHIEMSNTPGQPYAWGTPAHPDERRLEMEPTVLSDILQAALGQATNPQCSIFDEFVIHPVYKCGITWNG